MGCHVLLNHDYAAELLPLALAGHRATHTSDGPGARTRPSAPRGAAAAGGAAGASPYRIVLLYLIKVATIHEQYWYRQ